MKFLFLSIVLWAGAGVRPAGLYPILTDYYQVKDALVSGDADAAAKAAAELLHAIDGVDMKSLAAADHTAFMSLKDKLAFDARHISESKDIDHQRGHFVSLSTNVFKLAKRAKLSSAPIYQDYCPMRKAYWLSSDTAIRNPYLGGSMRTCGKVTATLKP
jgi:hypothetical protein